MADDEQAPDPIETTLDTLERQFGKVGAITFSGHTIYFRRPTRDEAREYRRMQSSTSEAPDASERLAQVTIVGFDTTTDPNAARVMFTGSFLVQYPLAVASPRFASLLAALAGLAEDEDCYDLGKGVRLRGIPPRPSPKG